MIAFRSAVPPASRSKKEEKKWALSVLAEYMPMSHSKFKPGAKRLTRETSPSLMKIPALPISYGDAQVLLGAMDGVVAPANWRGHLGITYRVTGAVPVHLAVKSEGGLKPIYDVVATLKGSQ